MSSKKNKKSSQQIDNQNIIKDKNDKNDNNDNNDNNDKNKNEQNLITNNLHNPYKKTILSTPIMISPDQMDNKMYIHVKANLINKLENKCYENYGYIEKIYNIPFQSVIIIF